MIKKMIKKVQGFTPVELVLVVGLGALIAGTLIFMATSPQYMAQQPINVNVKLDGVTASRTPVAMAQEVAIPTSITVVGTGNTEKNKFHPISEAPCTEDVFNVQRAVLLHDEVKLQGTFDFGTDFKPMGSGSVLIVNSTQIIGVDGSGDKAIVENGYAPFIAAAPAGDVTIKNIHFKNNGGFAMLVKSVGVNNTCTVQDNTFTNNLWGVLKDIDESLLPNPNNYYGPGGFNMPGFIQDTIAAVGPVVPSKLFFHPAPFLKKRLYVSVLVGNSSFPYGIKGDVVVKNNYLNLEEGLPMGDEVKKVFYSTYGVHSVGIDQSAKFNVFDNEIHNTSAHGISVIDNLGDAVLKDNKVYIGAVDANDSGESAVGILAKYGRFKMPYGSDGLVYTGGVVKIQDNDVYVGSQTGIRIIGIDGFKYPDGCEIDGNTVVMTKMDLPAGINEISYGFEVSDIEGLSVTGNTVEGEGMYALSLGNVTAQSPLPTDNNVIDDFKAANFTPTTGTYVKFDADAHNNTLSDYKGFDAAGIEDLGTNNSY